MTHRTRILLLLVILGITAPLVQRIYANRSEDNFHEIVPGTLYRSAQPSAEDVARYAKEYGIRTIINLRDEKREAWYDDERHAAAAHGIQIIDFPLSSGAFLPADQSRALAERMAEAEAPVLIHCEHGINRTGLASAIYLNTILNRSEWTASLQLSPYYGYLAIPKIGRPEMAQSFEAYTKSTLPRL